MKPLVLLALALAAAPLASAQLYKYVDKDGKTVYSDQPPPSGDGKQLRLQAPAPAPASGPAPAKSALEKDKELEKARKEARDQAKKGADSAKAAQAAEERCANARSNYAVYEQGTRLMKRLPSGERVFLEENEIASEKAKARADMDEACKKS